MKKVEVALTVWLQLEVEDDIAEDSDKIYDAINELDYSFNSYDIEKKVEVNDYYIAEYDILKVA